jgi:hypothetical protein
VGIVGGIAAEGALGRSKDAAPPGRRQVLIEGGHELEPGAILGVEIRGHDEHDLTARRAA